jgi:hypothetical protein
MVVRIEFEIIKVVNIQSVSQGSVRYWISTHLSGSLETRPIVIASPVHPVQVETLFYYNLTFIAEGIPYVHGIKNTLPAQTKFSYTAPTP